MNQAPARQELAQIRLALERDTRAPATRAWLFLFWGLIVAKICFIEWAVTTYRQPWNPLVLQLPTFLFGLLATLVQTGVSRPPLLPLAGRMVLSIWGAGLMILVLFGVGGVATGLISPFLLPPLGASLLGAGYFIHSALDGRLLHRFCAYLWWFCAAFLFLHPNLDGLGWFSAFLILFQTLPTLALLFLARKN